MKSITSGGILLFLFCVLDTGKAQTPDAPKLTGIVCLPNRTVALLEITGPPAYSRVSRAILTPGERQDNYEVISIDETKGEVTLGQVKSQTAIKLKLEGGSPPVKQTFN